MTRAAQIITVTPNCVVDRTIGVRNLQIGDTAVARVMSRVGAGKGVNVSRALAALAVQSVATGIVGSDCVDLFRGDLERLGVRCAFVTVDSPTRMSTTILDSQRGTETHLRERGRSVGPDAVRALSETTVKLSRRACYVAVCGSLPPGFSRRALAELVGALHHVGAKVIVDVDGSVLSGLRREPVFLAAPNVSELSRLARAKLISEKSIVAAIRRQVRHFENLLVSWGKRGAFLCSEEGLYRARLEEEIDMRNTVGCGDALLAGFLAARVSGAGAADALAEAVAVAGSAARTPRAGALHLAALRQYRGRVRVWKV